MESPEHQDIESKPEQVEQSDATDDSANPKQEENVILKSKLYRKWGIIAGVFAAMLAFAGIIIYSIQDHKNATSDTQVPTPTVVQNTVTKAPSMVPSDAPSATVQPTKYVNPISTVVPTTPAATVTPTSQPHSANPPQINIFTPTEGQTITYANNNNSARICVGDGPAGGDTSSLERKSNINGGGWSGWMNIGPLCFDAINGTNTIQLQYRNGWGDVSEVYTRTFIFQN